jgi:protein transport protein SEC23
MDFSEKEASDGIRFSWNYWPHSKAMQSEVVVPVSWLYTPLKDIEGLQMLEYNPIYCRSCKAILNPCCHLDFRFKSWRCPFCSTDNHFPNHYAQHITETNLPGELVKNYTTVEYILPGAAEKPVFLLVIDTCIEESELSEIKDSVQQSLALLPEDALVGLITYGRHVFVHELGSPGFPKAYVFKGDKPKTPSQIQEALKIINSNDPRAARNIQNLKKFLVPVVDWEANLNNILDDLQPDPFPVAQGTRVLRCTGNAIDIAVGLLEWLTGVRGSRIITMVGGNCTFGPGKVVDEKLTITIRSHQDILKQNEKTVFMKEAITFYDSLASRALKRGIVVDLFVASVDQSGVLEMKSLFEKTGGYYIMTDSFQNPVYKESFSKFFTVDDEGHLKMGFLGKLNIFTSKEFKVCGCIGSWSSTNLKTGYVSDTVIGVGNTSEWNIGGIDKNSSLAFYFDIFNKAASSTNAHPPVFLQFQTKYQHSDGSTRIRVTTVQRWLAAPEDRRELAYGFDQEAAAVLMARYAVIRCQIDEPLDVIRWLDRMLIKLVSKFAEYKRDDPNSFKLSREFSLYPGFMFYLRRSQFLQTFNASPDETVYYRSLLWRENVSNSLVMIQPSLMQYTTDSDQPIPVFLESSSMKTDVILLLDTFFYILIWHGENIITWKEQGYHEMEGYEGLKDMFEAPREDAKMIMQDRFPTPRYYLSKPGDSHERKIKARINPASGKSTTDDDNENNIFTEDVSLKIFNSHLIKLAVQSS